MPAETLTRYTVRLNIVQEDFAASITRHNVAATNEKQAISKATLLAETETGREGWELDSNGVEETED